MWRGGGVGAWQWGRGGADILSLVPLNHPMRLVLLPPVTLEHVEA